MQSAWRYYKVSCRGNETFVRATSPAHAKQIILSIVSSHNKWGYELSAQEWDIQDTGKAEVNNVGLGSWVITSTDVPTGTNIY
jgi:hypothetical protein